MHENGNTRKCISAALLSTILILAVTAQCLGKTARLWEPVEFSLKNPTWQGNPYDVVAVAKCVHGKTGKTISQELFFAGDKTWKLRFTGTKTGEWTISTDSRDVDLAGFKARVDVEANPEAPGFVSNSGSKWIRTGTDKAFVPQYAMYAAPVDYHNKPDRIDRDVREFIIEHGFNGFHTGVLCSWFDIEKTRASEITDPDPNPDPRTFEALEMLIRKVYAAGGVVHIWTWGDEQRRMTPIKWGLNGKIDRRLQGYICARLGPLPGWTMGYGFDLQEWVRDEGLRTWHKYMHEHMGYRHLLGGRAPDLIQICDGLDYSSYQQHRPDYDLYVKAINLYPDKPTFLEDRFRVRKNVYPDKDYDFDMTRRGLWHSTMAGGAANIWGNLLDPREDGMSHPYPNKHQIKTWSLFWQNRFAKNMTPDNSLTDGVCLKDPGNLLVFYKEDTDSIRMNLAGIDFKRIVVVDTCAAYKEIPVRDLRAAPGQIFKALHRSDWAVAVECN